MNSVPNSPDGKQDPKSNTATGDITPSNKSSQTPQAAAQNMPAGTPTRVGKTVIGGAGSGSRQIVSGKLGRASFRK